MRSVETDWWRLSLPEEWLVEQDEESVVIADRDGLGSLSITALRSVDPDTAAVDLETIIADLGLDIARGRKQRLGAFSALYFESREEQDFIREWFVVRDDLILLISYECDIEDRDMDRAAVDEILSTVEPV